MSVWHQEHGRHLEEVFKKGLSQPGGDGVGMLQERTRIPAEGLDAEGVEDGAQGPLIER